MANKVAPDDLSISLQRNERLMKNAQRQIDHDVRERTPKNKDQERKPRSKPQPEKERRKKQRRSDEKEDKQKYSAPGKVEPEVCPSVDEFVTTRVDAVVFIVVLVQIIGCIAVGFEIYAYTLDQEWNSVLNGQSAIKELEGHNVFRQKTLKMTGHIYLEKAAEYVARDEPQELVFIILIVIFMIISFIQIIACYIKAKDVEQYAAMLIGLYAIGGAICMFSSILLISASINIENSYTYAADMLHNFRFISQAEPLGSKDRDKCHNEYLNGCDQYEYAKKQALYLERIFRQCGQGSRFTRYSGEGTSKMTVEIGDEIYFRTELKEMGFCSRDGYKYTAAACVVVMGMLCAIVPVIFCCEGKALGKKGSLYNEPDVQDIMAPKPTQPEPEQSQPQRDELKSSAVLAQFRAYVEKNSEDDNSKSVKREGGSKRTPKASKKAEKVEGKATTTPEIKQGHATRRNGGDDERRHEERSSAKHKERSAARNEDRSATRNEDRSATRNEDRSAARNEDRSAARNEDRSATRNEHHSARNDERHSARNDERHSARNDERHSARNDERHSARNDERHSARNDERHSARNDERHSARSEERHSARSEERHSARSEERHSARNEERNSARNRHDHTPGRGDRTKQLESVDDDASSSSSKRRAAREKKVTSAQEYNDSWNKEQSLTKVERRELQKRERDQNANQNVDGNWDAQLEATRKHRSKRDAEQGDKQRSSKEAEDLMSSRKPLRNMPRDISVSV